MVYTVHFVDGTWRLYSHCFEALYVPDDHTAECLQDAFKSILEDWHLDASKQALLPIMVVNIKRACQLLAWTNLSFFGHNLDLLINKGLSKPQNERVVRL